MINRTSRYYTICTAFIFRCSVPSLLGIPPPKRNVYNRNQERSEYIHKTAIPLFLHNTNSFYFGLPCTWLHVISHFRRQRPLPLQPVDSTFRLFFLWRIFKNLPKIMWLPTLPPKHSPDHRALTRTEGRHSLLTDVTDDSYQLNGIKMICCLIMEQ